MLILWAIPLGVIAGYLLGGRAEGISSLHFRWPWLAIGGLLLQVVLFSPLGDIAGSAGPALYIVSTAAVFVAVLRNVRIPGLVLVALGSLSNLAAITANGGAMPADAEALVIAGLDPKGHTNSVVLADPALRPLTDIYAAPSWVPFANVFSVGDVLIGLGVAIAIAAAMRAATPPAPAPDAVPAESRAP
jgi:hypothetical protein